MGADRRIGFALGEAAGAKFFASEDTGGPTTILEPMGSVANYHTLTVFGAPGTTSYDWYLDGASAGTRDVLDSSITNGGKVIFSSGSSPLIGAASNIPIALHGWPSNSTICPPTTLRPSIPPRSIRSSTR